ncbi:MAG TPA: hypothetical protein VFI90_16090 [Rubrobacter sp.]|nr:hypothetical protein [Rubrobacter sp.]
MGSGSRTIGTRRGPWVGLLFAMVLMLSACVSACAGEPGKEAANAQTRDHTAHATTKKAHKNEAHLAETHPLPDLGIPPTPTNLTPGRYATDEFEPSVSFSVGKGWAINNPEKTDHFSIYSRDFAKSDKESGAVLTFVNVRAVFDPQSPTEDNIRSKPKDLLAWFEQHPRLNISKPAPTTIGGVSAKRFDASVSSLPKERLDECPKCLPVFGLQYEEPVSILKEYKQRITLAEGPSSESVAIILYGPPDQIDSYLPKAQEVLKTVEWKGA